MMNTEYLIQIPEYAISLYDARFDHIIELIDILSIQAQLARYLYTEGDIQIAARSMIQITQAVANITYHALKPLAID